MHHHRGGVAQVHLPGGPPGGGPVDVARAVSPAHLVELREHLQRLLARQDPDRPTARGRLAHPGPRAVDLDLAASSGRSVAEALVDHRLAGVQHREDLTARSGIAELLVHHPRQQTPAGPVGPHTHTGHGRGGQPPSAGNGERVGHRHRRADEFSIDVGAQHPARLEPPLGLRPALVVETGFQEGLQEQIAGRSVLRLGQHAHIGIAHGADPARFPLGRATGFRPRARHVTSGDRPRRRPRRS